MGLAKPGAWVAATLETDMNVQARNWTYAGLVIALFGLPAIVTLYNQLVSQPNDGAIAIRELAILALTGILLWIVTAREKLPLSSIGLRFDRPGRSLLWGVGLAVALFALLIGILAVYSTLGIKYGEGGKIAPSLWVAFLTVIRAGISEEVFYRGFALERIESLSGSKWIAAAVTLLVFAGFHYRQGPAGIFIAFAVGAAITLFYLWKRDLLAAIIAHFLVDFLPNVLFPLLGAGD
jgi:membrane protease YdiL (CAAX protease family)